MPARLARLAFAAFFGSASFSEASSLRQVVSPVVVDTLKPFGGESQPPSAIESQAPSGVKQQTHSSDSTVLSGRIPAKKHTEYESYRERHDVELRVEGLRKSQDAIANMAERSASKLKADMNDIDHMLVRQHMLTDRKAETSADVKTIEAESSTLKKAATDFSRGGRVADSKAAETDAADLDRVASALGGSAGELEELEAEIKRVTEDGRQMDVRVKSYAEQRAVLDRQIKRLNSESEHLQEGAAEEDDFKSFAHAGDDGSQDEDDPYMREAAAALEKASGWNGAKLDSEATKAREAMTSGLSGGPSHAMQALKGGF